MRLFTYTWDILGKHLDSHSCCCNCNSYVTITCGILLESALSIYIDDGCTFTSHDINRTQGDIFNWWHPSCHKTLYSFPFYVCNNAIVLCDVIKVLSGKADVCQHLFNLGRKLQGTNSVKIFFKRYKETKVHRCDYNKILTFNERKNFLWFSPLWRHYYEWTKTFLCVLYSNVCYSIGM